MESPVNHICQTVCVGVCVCLYILVLQVKLKNDKIIRFPWLLAEIKSIKKKSISVKLFYFK